MTTRTIRERPRSTEASRRLLLKMPPRTRRRARRYVLVALCALAAVLRSTAARAVEVTVGLSPAADTTIFEESGDTSDAKGPNVFAGRNASFFSLIRRALLRFDVAAAIPAGRTLSSASLRINLTRSNSNSVIASLYRVSAAWGEGVSNSGLPGGNGAPATPGDATWTKRVYPGTDWTNPGGDTALAASASTLIGTSLADYFFASTPKMRADVQSWIDQPATNFGWQLQMDEAQVGPTAKRFGSRENPDPAVRPLLLVTYDDRSVAAPPAAVPALDGSVLVALAALLAAGGLRLLRRPA